MKKNLKSRVALIVAVLAVCMYGIFGIPNGVSGSALMKAFTSRIHLGLDLQGGAHLILQVQVQDAVNDETDNMLVSVQQDLKKANVPFTHVIKPNPKNPALVEVDGIPPVNSSAARSIFDTKFSNEYDINPGANGSYTLTMKPNVEQELEQRTVAQAIDTIRSRVDAMGVSEPEIAPYSLGQNQILVELPGISNLDQVKSIIQDTARLEIHPVVGGPYPSEQAALQTVSGTLPPEDDVVPFAGTIGNQNGGDQFYMLQRMAVVGWQRLPLRRSGHESRYRPAHRGVHADQRSR